MTRHTVLPLVALCLVALVVASARAGPSDVERKAAPAPRLHVLAIGIDRYPHLPLQAQLELAVSDVKSIVKELDARSPPAYEAVNVTTLFDEDATRPGIERAFEDLVRTARPQDIVFVQFSGSGRPIPIIEGGEENALWSHETTLEAVRTGEGNGLITFRRFGAWMTRIEANRQVFVLDTSSSSESLLRRLQTVLIERDARLSNIVPRTRVVIGLDGVGWEAPSVLANGPVTATILRALAGEADIGARPGGWITAYDLEAALPLIYRKMLYEVLDQGALLSRALAQRLRVMVVGSDVPLLASSSLPTSAESDAPATRGRLELPEDEDVGAAAESSAPRRDHALLFATDAYEDPGWRGLNNPILDARALKKTLEGSYGFSCKLVEDPTYDEMIAAIAELQRRTFGPDDQLLVFVAGHGTYNDVLKQGYVIARDSSAGAKPERALGNAELRSAVEAIDGCGHILVVLDTCYGGTFDAKIASGGHRGGDVYERSGRDAFVQEVLQQRTRRYLTSGGKKYVSDGRPGRHSPFMYHLLDRLRGDEARAKGLVTSTDLEAHLQGLRPEPRAGWFGSNEPGAKFLFIRREE